MRGMAAAVLLLGGIGLNAALVQNVTVKGRQIIKPQYPEKLNREGVSEKFTVTYGVDKEGWVTNPRVMGAPNAELAWAALEALVQWEFEPIKIGGQKTGGAGLENIDFKAGGADKPGEVVLERETVIKAVDTKRKPAVTVAPQLKEKLNPVYPDKLLDANIAGEAEVRFLVNEAGQVTFSKILTASHDEFGKALLAAIEAGKFAPAKTDGKPRSAFSTLKHTFDPMGGKAAQMQRVEQQIVAKGGAAAPAKPKQLDLPLKPRIHVQPTYPTAIFREKQEGEAEIQCYINAEGVPLFPKVVSATREEFGYAAMQALSQWRFVPPTAGGKPCIVSVQIPLGFKLDEWTKREM
jgi:TonB family protein